MHSLTTFILQWLQYDVEKLESVGSLAMFADFTRRVCYYDCHGKTDLFKLILLSESALKLHVSRCNYILKLVSEVNNPITDTFKELNDGWTMEKGKVSIKWEENIQDIRKGLNYKKPCLSAGIGCTCKSSCSLSAKGTSRCNRGGKCNKSPLSS